MMGMDQASARVAAFTANPAWMNMALSLDQSQFASSIAQATSAAMAQSQANQVLATSAQAVADSAQIAAEAEAAQIAATLSEIEVEKQAAEAMHAAAEARVAGAAATVAAENDAVAATIAATQANAVLTDEMIRLGQAHFQVVEAIGQAVTANNEEAAAATRTAMVIAQSERQVADVRQEQKILIGQLTEAKRGDAASNELVSRSMLAVATQMPGLNGQFFQLAYLMQAAGKEGISTAAVLTSLSIGAVAAGTSFASSLFGVFSQGLTQLRLLAGEFSLTTASVAGLQAQMIAVGLPAQAVEQALRSLSAQTETMNNQLDAGVAPTGRLAHGLEAIGITGQDANGQMLPMQQLLPAIFEGFKKTADQAQLTGERFNAAGVASEIFSARFGPKMVAMLEEGNAGWEKYTAEVERAGIGSAEQIAKLDALHQATASTGIEMKGLGMSIGADVAPIVTSFIGKAGDLAQMLSHLSGWQKDLIITFPLVAGGIYLLVQGSVALGTALLPVIAETYAAVAGFMAQVAAEGLLAAATGVLSAAMETAIPELLLISAVTAGVIFLIHGFTDSNNAAADSMEKVGKAGTTAALGVEQFANQLYEAASHSDKTHTSLELVTQSINRQIAGWHAAGMTTEEVKKNIDDMAGSMAGMTYIAGTNTLVANVLQKAYMNLRDEEATGIAISTQHASAMDKLAERLGLTETHVMKAAEAHDFLDSAVKKSLTSLKDEVGFTEAYDRAVKDATLSDAAWTEKRKELLTLSTKGTEDEKLAAKLEIELGDATRALTVDVAQLIVQQDRAVDSTLKFAQAMGTLLTDTRTSSAELIKFNVVLAEGAAAGSQAWSDQFGAGAQRIVTSMQSAAQFTVDAWRTADAQLLADEATFDQMMENRATTSELAIQKAKIDTDRITTKSKQDAANDAIGFLQTYLTAVQTSFQSELTLHGQLFDATIHLAHLTVEEKAYGLGKWLEAEQVTIAAIQALEEELKTTTDAATKATLATQIKADQDRLLAIKEEVREIESAVSWDKKELKLDTKAFKEGIAEINGVTTAVRDMNTVVAAGDALLKTSDDLVKQVGASKMLITQGELSGLHQVTEAARTRAAADLAAAGVAQEAWKAVVGGYDATTKASRAYSDAEVRAAEAAYKTTSGLLATSVAEFNEAFTKESQGQTALDNQRAASATSSERLSTDQRTFQKEELAGQTELTSAIVLGQGLISKASTAASNAALDSWRAADAAVIEIDRQLSGELSVENRKRLDDERKGAVSRQQDAHAAATLVLNELRAEGTAAVTLAHDTRVAIKDEKALELSDVYGVATATIQSYVDTTNQILAIDKQLTGSLTEDQRAILNATKTSLLDQKAVYHDVASDAISTFDAVAKAHNSAINSQISDVGKLFDLNHRLTHLTREEQMAGVGGWVAAEANAVSQIIALQLQLAATTDRIQIAQIQHQIERLTLLVAVYAEKVHEMDVAAQDLVKTEKASTSAIGGTASAAGSLFVPAMQQAAAVTTQVTTALQAATTAFDNMLGVINQPSTEELQLTAQLDQVTIQLARAEEAGAAKTDKDVVALLAEQAVIQAKVSAYASERNATISLAEAQGKLAGGLTNSIGVMRDTLSPLMILEERLNAAKMSSINLYSTTTAAQSWSSGIIGAIDGVTKAYTQLAEAASSAKSSVTSGGSSSSASSGTSGGISVTGGGGSHAAGLGMSGFVSSIPSFDLGGRMPFDGLAYLHKDEDVLRPGTLRTGSAQPLPNAAGPITVTIPVTINGTSLSPQQLEQAIQAGTAVAIAEAFGRGATLSGRRT